jgi:acetyl esterase/lipase
MERKPGALSPISRVTSTTPPMFLAHAADDPVDCRNSVEMFLALKDSKIKTELHLYSSGGHGFGLRPGPHPCSSWPKRCEEWMHDMGFLGAAGADARTEDRRR